MDVSVNKEGYAVDGNPQRVAVHPGSSVSPGGGNPPQARGLEFIRLTADGEAHIEETTNLALEFGGAIGDGGLALTDIHLNAGGTGAKADSLSGGGTSYNLSVSRIEAEGEVSVIVKKAGYAFKPASQTVTAHQKGISVAMNVAQTGGAADASASATTTGLTLSFDPAIEGLDPGDITLTPEEGGQHLKGSVVGNRKRLLGPLGKRYKQDGKRNRVGKEGRLQHTRPKGAGVLCGSGNV